MVKSVSTRNRNQDNDAKVRIETPHFSQICGSTGPSYCSEGGFHHYITKYFPLLPVSAIILTTLSSEETGIPVDELPSSLEKPTFCDTCHNKGKSFITATAYCVECDRKYCATHQEVHVSVFTF